MTRNPITAHPNAGGLYQGVPAVAFALHAAGQPAYATALETLDGHIATLSRHRLELAHKRIDLRHLPALRGFDLIRGLTGIGAYLFTVTGQADAIGRICAWLDQ